MKTYDVCNDLSLSLAEETPKSGYKWVKGDVYLKGEIISVELGYCTKHKELHYLRTKSETNLDGSKFRGFCGSDGITLQR